MTHTLVASEKRQVIIGFDQPFSVIGERINPTGRKKLAAEMMAGNFETDQGRRPGPGRGRRAHARRQCRRHRGQSERDRAAAAARRRSRSCRRLVDLPLCIDSSVPAALEAGLETVKGRPLVNSVTGEEEKLEAILPLVKKYNVPVVAISNDETGISEDPDVRFAVAKKIVERARRLRHQAA